jgi:hypothetical protein
MNALGHKWKHVSGGYLFVWKKCGNTLSNYMTQYIYSVMCFTILCADWNVLQCVHIYWRELNGVVFCVIVVVVVVVVVGKIKIYQIFTLHSV